MRATSANNNATLAVTHPLIKAMNFGQGKGAMRVWHLGYCARKSWGEVGVAVANTS